MHRDSAPERDVSGDRLRAQRRAAARERGRQIADALDVDRRSAAARGGARRARGPGQWLGLEQPRRRVHQLCHRDLALTEQLVQVVYIACPQLAHERGKLLGARPDARELAFGELRPGAAIGADVLPAKPGALLRLRGEAR